LGYWIVTGFNGYGFVVIHYSLASIRVLHYLINTAQRNVTGIFSFFWAIGFG